MQAEVNTEWQPIYNKSYLQGTAATSQSYPLPTQECSGHTLTPGNRSDRLAPLRLSSRQIGNNIERLSVTTGVTRLSKIRFAMSRPDSSNIVKVESQSPCLLFCYTTPCCCFVVSRHGSCTWSSNPTRGDIAPGRAILCLTGDSDLFHDKFVIS